MEFPDRVKAKNARVFMFRHPMLSVSKCLVKGIISSMPRLRILRLGSCHACQLVELPSTIGNLKHLRFLDMSQNGLIKSLPKTVCELVNLECLLLAGCYQLEELPLMIHRLVRLRFIFLTSRQRSLVGFNRFHSLRHMFLVSCTGLESLWDNDEVGHLTSLRSLRIANCGRLKRLPDSMKLLVDLEELVICNCKELDLASGEALSGLQGLRTLLIIRVPSLKCLPNPLKSAAGSLKHLFIEDCERLVGLPDWLQTCTSLQHLKILDCPDLLCLPQGIGLLNSFRKLEIKNCPHLSQRFAIPAGQDFSLIENVPEIWLDGRRYTSNQH